MKKKENELSEMNNEFSNQQNIIREKPKISTKRKIYRVIIVIILIYCSIGIALYHLQEKFLFHPVALPPDFQFKFDIPFKEVNIAMKETGYFKYHSVFSFRFSPKRCCIVFSW